jgi:hypothetical protein
MRGLACSNNGLSGEVKKRRGEGMADGVLRGEKERERERERERETERCEARSLLEEEVGGGYVLVLALPGRSWPCS